MKIDPASRNDLVTQIEEGLRRRMSSGEYPPGARLPSRRELAISLGVGECTVRAAYERLRQKGFVVLRPGRGCEVVGRKPRLTDKVVLDLLVDDSVTFASTVFSEELRRFLESRVVSCRRLVVSPKAEASMGIATLKRELAAGVSLVVLRTATDAEGAIARCVASCGVPYVLVFRNCVTSKTCVGNVRFDTGRAVSAFVDDVVRAGLKTVAQLDFGPDTYLDASVALEERGLAVTRLSVSLADVDLDGIVTEAERQVGRLLDKGPRPDLLFATDDFLSSGAVAALLARGVSVPGDIRMVTYGNCGSGFSFRNSFACIEFDPRVDGREVGSQIVRWMRTGKFGPYVSEPTYCRGATFPVW